MADFERDATRLYYEEHGDGFPLLLIAPGGMRSAIPFWQNAPWDPIEQLSPHFRVIAMDQRNAGRSEGPIRADDGWHTYTEDQLALLDHLEIERFHVAGMCIGGPYCLGLIEAAPERVAAGVLFQPIGLDDNREAFYQMFDAWAGELRESNHSDVPDETWARFRSHMYDEDFVFAVDRDFVGRCATPLLVLMGNDLYHPSSTSRELVELAPDAELVEQWKEPEHVAAARERVLEFLLRHTPAS